MHNQTFQKECEEMKGSHPFSISYGKLKYSLPPILLQKKNKKWAPRHNFEYLIPILPMCVN